MREEFGFTGTLVGFAAETENIEVNALDKLERKGCDYLVANDVSRSDIGFDQDTNEVIIFSRDGDAERLDRASKAQIAAQIIKRIQ